MGFYHQIGWAFRLKISHHPILWNMDQTWTSGFCLQQPSHGVTGVVTGSQESTLSGLTPASTPMTGAGAEDLWSDEAGPKFLDIHRGFWRFKPLIFLQIEKASASRNSSHCEEVTGKRTWDWLFLRSWQVLQLSSVSFSGRWRQQPVALQMPSHLRILVLVFRALPRLRLREQGLPTAIDLCRMSSQQDAQCQGRSWVVTFKPKATFFLHHRYAVTLAPMVVWTTCYVFTIFFDPRRPIFLCLEAWSSISCDSNATQELGIPQNWAIKGFRQIPPSEIGGRARQDCRCFAGAQIGLDRTW